MHGALQVIRRRQQSVVLGIEPGKEVPGAVRRIYRQRTVDRPLQPRPAADHRTTDALIIIAGWIAEHWMAQPLLALAGEGVVDGNHRIFRPGGHHEEDRKNGSADNHVIIAGRSWLNVADGIKDRHVVDLLHRSS